MAPIAPEYTPATTTAVPVESELSLGCGNPTGLAELRSGEVVLDLGSGAGRDCFIAARQVGPSGRVVGVDMTPTMIDRARGAAARGQVENVEFRLGEIEHLPCPDRSFDVVLSNCVLNLAPDQRPVFEEALRVLRPGGRLAVSDMVATRPISEEQRRDMEAWASCSSGAIPADEVRRILSDVGFESIRIEPASAAVLPDGLGVVPMTIRARRPMGEA